MEYFPEEKLSVLPYVVIEILRPTPLLSFPPPTQHTVNEARVYGNLCPGLTVFSGVLFPAFSFPQIPVGVAMDIKHV